MTVEISPEAYKKLQEEGKILPVPESVLDIQVGGDHYKRLGEYQPWQVYARWMTEEELFGHMKGTVLSYLARKKDNPREDAEKAMHTIQLYLEVSAAEAERKKNETL